jgi:predicted ATPase/class 3 adenylate cyclase
VAGRPQGEGFTFLFTDIEGSSRLWDLHPESMALALPLHDALIGAAITRHGGEVFKNLGDGLCAVFAGANEALLAAIDLQQQLASESWPGIGALRVRVAVHSGDASVRGGDYFGPTLNRVARLLQLAHGGQVLLSLAARELCSQVPAEASLVDLGIHPLRDLTRPEHVYQVIHPSLPGDFPPVRSEAIVRNNLPAATTGFVGRERELADLRQAVGGGRLITITGMGGSGKTRMALRLAEAMLADFSDGVWFAELAALSEEALVAQTVAQAVGLQREGLFASNDPWLDRLTESLEDKHLLLVLDNCEQVVGACAELADVILRRCRQVRIIATSREKLAIEGEQVYPLSPLPVPSTRKLASADAMRSDAVALFVQRARSHDPTFEPTPENLDAVVDICRRLEGIPLAIELAAARVGVLPTAEISARLGDRLSLRASNRSMPERHRSIRAMLDWSEELLPDHLRILFHRLSVFRGSFGLPAVEIICSARPLDRFDLLELLRQLVDRSTVRAVVQSGEARYSLLETVRQYAAMKLTEDGEASETARRHSDYYLDLVIEAEPQLETKRQTRFTDLLDTEIDEIRAALERSILMSDAEFGLRMAAPLWYFWFIRGHLSEGRRWLDRIFSIERDAPPQVRSRALAAAGLLTVLENPERAETLSTESFDLAEQSQDRGGSALASFALGWRCMYSGEFQRMRGHLEYSRREFLALGDRWGRGMACMFLGVARDALGDREGGEAACHEALEAFQTSGDRLGGAYARINYGELLRARGEDERAALLYEEGLATFREVGERTGAAVAALNLGMVLSRRGELERATELLRESLSFGRDGSKVLLPVCLAGMGGLAVASGDLLRAAALFGAAQAAGEQIGAGLQYADRIYYDEQVAALRGALAPTDVEVAWANGYAMSSRDAIALALESGSRAFQHAVMYPL